MENEHKILYCYKFIEPNDGSRATLHKITINNWKLEYINQYNHKCVYKFKADLVGLSYTHYVLPEERMDKFRNDKFFTFNPDENYAKQAIEQHLYDCILDAQLKLNRCVDKLNAWESKNEL